MPYNAMVQQLLDSIGGYGGQPTQRQHAGSTQMLKDNLYGNALAQASGGILGRQNSSVPSPSQTASTPTAASTPTISDDDLDDIINSLFGSGAGGGGSVSRPPSNSSGGNELSHGGSLTTGGGSTGSSSGSTGMSGGGQGVSLTTRRLDREGGQGPGTRPLASGGQTNVAPGGGFISYGTSPQKKTQGYWWESEPWYQG